MGINFPNAPTVGQLWPQPATPGLPVYRWDGQAWMTGSVDIIGTVRYDAVQTLTAAQKAQARANIDALKKNYIINGAMQISQENGTTAGTVNGYFAADMFGIGYSGMSGAYTFAQVASPTPGGSPNRVRLTVTTADASVGAGDIVVLSQTIEGLRAADLKSGTANAKTVTVQFGVKAPAGTYCVNFRTNPAYTRTYVAEYTIAAGEANTDVVKSVTLTLDTTGTWPFDNASGIAVSWTLMAGTTNQIPANVWQAGSAQGTSNQFNFMSTAGNIFELFDVGLYEGTVAPAFQVPDYVSELVLCQRYWGKSYVYLDRPGLITSAGNVQYAAGGTGGEFGPTISYTTEMRIIPAYVLYSPVTGASGMRRNLSAGADEAVAGFNATGTKSHSGSQTAHTAGTVYGYHFTRNARL